MSNDTNGSSQPSQGAATPTTADRLAEQIKEQVRVYGLDLVLHGRAESRVLHHLIDQLASLARQQAPTELETVRSFWQRHTQANVDRMSLEDLHADVEQQAKQEAACTRSHPHEEMSHDCQRLTEIARLTNENARLKADRAAGGSVLDDFAGIHPPSPCTAKELSEAELRELILQTVYEGDGTIPYRDQWSQDIGIPFARAIERAHGIPGARQQATTTPPKEPSQPDDAFERGRQQGMQQERALWELAEGGQKLGLYEPASSKEMSEVEMPIEQILKAHDSLFPPTLFKDGIVKFARLIEAYHGIPGASPLV